MRFGPRRPSFRKRLAARTSWKRYVRHSLGVKAPRGMGWLTNPRKAAYNRIYSRTTFDLFKAPRFGSRARGGRQAAVGGGRALVVIFVVIVLIALLPR